jgi:Domain of unknown function (DUF4406)
MKTIYISGPITNIEGGNQQAFAAATDLLNELGYAAINPHQLFTNIDTTDFEWEDYMRGCIVALMQANEVVTIDGWEQSRGAIIEVDLARKLNIPVTHIVKYESEAKQLADKLERALPENQPKPHADECSIEDTEVKTYQTVTANEQADKI